MTRLPPGWALARVADVADIDIGFAFKSAQYVQNGIRLLRGENIEPGALRWVDTRYWPESGIDAFRHLIVRPGDVILAMDRPVVSAGLKLARARVADCPCLLVQRVARLRGRQGTTAFLCHALSSPAFVRHVLVGGQTGTQLPHISGKRIESFEFPLAPESEQQRIVEAIESYFTRLDDAVATLERVERNLKRYRASVLKSAVEGRLVPTEATLAKQEGRSYEPAAVLLDRILAERRRRWVESGKKGKYEEPVPPDTDVFAGLPDGWCWASLEQFLVGIEAGKNFRCEERPPDSDEIGVVKVSAVSWGRFLEDESKTCTRTELMNDELLIQPGDLLFSRANTIELVGACVIVGAVTRRLMLSDKILRLRTVGGLERWLLWVLRSNYGRRQIEKLATGNQESMRNIGQKAISQICIPLPPQAEIRRLVAAIDAQITISEDTSHVADSSLGRCSRLRQSILKWAFEGKLADQDANDEPAVALLERIKAKREAGEPPKARATNRQHTVKKQVRA